MTFERNPRRNRHRSARRACVALALFTLAACEAGPSASRCAAQGGVLEHDVCTCSPGFAVVADHCQPRPQDAAVLAPDGGIEDEQPDADAGGLVDAESADASLDASAEIDPRADASLTTDASADSAIAVVCTPRGVWYAVFTEYNGGTCGSPTPGLNPKPTEIGFGGTLWSALVTENCTVEPQLSADGCSLRYEQTCTFADDPGVTERETGTRSMLSATEMTGTGDVVRTNAQGVVLCQSRFDFHAIAK